MATDSRSIRGALDAYSTVNSSGNTAIASRMIWKIRQNLVGIYTTIYGSTGYGIFLGAFIAINKMDDNNTNINTTSGGNTFIDFNHLVKGHTVDVSGAISGPNQNIGIGTAAYSINGNINQGLKHYNDTVQFGKGISIGIAPGILNNANFNLITGGTNGPAVLESNNTYRTANIKMSDFYGVEKKDPGGSPGTGGSGGYIWNDAAGDEKIVSSGPISVGNAAALLMGGNLNGTV